MSYIYFNKNGATSCVKTVSTQPTGHYLGVNVNGNAEYVRLANNTNGKICVNIGGSAYSTAEYPENTDFLITPEFICKRRASTETLCVYANGSLILNSSGTSCTAINIPDNAVITICGPYSGCYGNWTLNEEYLALNFTERNACFSINATTEVTRGCGYTYHSATDGEGCNYVCSVDGGLPSQPAQYINTYLYAYCFTTAHAYNGSVNVKANNGNDVYTSCTTSFSGTMNPGSVTAVNICFPAMTNMCNYNNDRAYASYMGLSFNGCCFLNNNECPRMYCCGFTGEPVGPVNPTEGPWWWSGTGGGIYRLEFKDYSFTRCTI